MNKDKPSTPDDRAGGKPEGEDNPLDSIGKAITDPLTSGAEPEEPRNDGRTPEAPGG
jgi:hypothetical protein